MTHEVWVVDDDDSIRWVLEQALRQEGLVIHSFANADEALQALEQSQPDALLTDIRMPGLDGLEMMERVHQLAPQLPVIVMTAHTDLDSAVSAYHRGAFEYLPKPFDIDETVTTVKRALESRAPAEPPETVAGGGFIGNARAMQEVFRLIGRLSKSELSVLITGETGTGKEVIARTLHETSPRADGPFVAINTAAIPAELLESELFGHEKGAFTGAQAARAGRFEQAHGGTLFLDEIGDMPASMQTRLLRVLAQGEFFRVGGHRMISVNVRILAATHQDLEAKVRQGEFREDLYHRLNVVKIHVPPLRERTEDIPALVEHFLRRAAEDTGLEQKWVSQEVLDALADYPWPGNVRELENFCQRMTVMAPGDAIQLSDLPEEMSGRLQADAQDQAWENHLCQWVAEQLRQGVPDLAQVVTQRVEAILIREALQATGGRKRDAAERLGWGRNTLTRKLSLVEELLARKLQGTTESQE